MDITGHESEFGDSKKIRRDKLLDENAMKPSPLFASSSNF